MGENGNTVRIDAFELHETRYIGFFSVTFFFSIYYLTQLFTLHTTSYIPKMTTIIVNNGPTSAKPSTPKPKTPGPKSI